ncbi:hypothetical protein BYT27DRAFT_7203486 [Phlegmacium glaucopus]|nr:hypothetical protein BYT27DRAFT_7203486 [Phlegmacium glaucopus]
MVNLTIVGALCGAIGVLIGALFTGASAYGLDILKRRREERDHVWKHRDSLLKACEQLQSRIVILPECSRERPKVKSSVYDPAVYDHLFTIFSFGRFFAWIFSLENEVLGVHPDLISRDKQVFDTVYEIRRALDHPHFDEPFNIFMGLQSAIGEVMMKDGKMGDVMGFAAFIEKWKSPAFREWFVQVQNGLETFADPPTHTATGRMCRIIQVQHLLISLIEILDPAQQRSHTRTRKRISSSGICWCGKCIPDTPASTRGSSSVSSNKSPPFRT